MVERNRNLANLTAGYLFPEIARRREALQAKHPDARIISLGIGDTTEPIPPHITGALVDAARRWGTREGYRGYGNPQGMPELRARIAERWYGGALDASEIYVSDGAKCDIGRIQLLFGPEAKVALQDPSYPVYVDGSVIVGQAGAFDPERAGYRGLRYLPCTPENGFFPDLDAAADADLLFFCSPNNPTGAAADRAQLERLVRFARETGCIVLFDAAYARYVREEGIPRSIFEIEGAREAAVEINSLSKPAGFTGLRLGWTAVPKELRFSDGTPVGRDWFRVISTIFNGASALVQHGALAALDDEGMVEMDRLVSFYMENGAIIKAALERTGIEHYGGVNAPYLWARIPGKSSWEAFGEILEKAHVVCTPGAGFGPAGEGFVRFSAFGRREAIEEAAARLERVL